MQHGVAHKAVPNRISEHPLAQDGYEGRNRYHLYGCPLPGSAGQVQGGTGADAGCLWERWPQTTQDVVLQRLSKVRYFAFGGTGYAGVISDGEKNYKMVLARSTALADFEKLFTEGNMQAKCYALVGIHKLNPTRFKDLVRPLGESKETVTIMQGCIVSDVPITRITKEIAQGKY